ncbi:GNAT family N-acetyltransferase [Isoptericola sp. AK164]|uniref:GNAT family N-acetyltransferase n=1 Tax=Isoptericola sp. AK164 TaxID=3024246 RepID=UPI0024185883|nr:GNAT family N-acetyltransferase [Isoptericola sp. AK164]
MSSPVDVDIHHDPEHGRYEARIAGPPGSAAEDAHAIGVLRYHREGDVVVIPGTVVVPEHRGHGVADALVRRALDDVAAAGATVRPDCWFVETWLRHHPDYQHLRWPQDSSGGSMDA